MSDTVRLSKRVVEISGCSRTEAVQYIEGGWVSVDDQVVEEPGVRVSPSQQVVLAPNASLEQRDPATIMVNKPAGMTLDAAYALIRPENQFAGDRSGIRFLKAHTTKMDSTDTFGAAASGIAIFTQDWRIARKLIEDSATLEYEYIVEVRGKIAEDGLARLNRSPKYLGKPTHAKVSWQNETRLRFAIKGPQPDHIPYLCELVGLTIVSMRLIRVGRITMSDLPSGQWRYIRGFERF
jgi:23S rRNA pseudouridine2604 synthase